MITKKNELRKIIMRRLTIFCKPAIFWAVIGFRENFTVKAPKCDYDEKHPKNYVKTKIQRGVKYFSKFGIFWFLMGLCDIFTVRS